MKSLAIVALLLISQTLANTEVLDSTEAPPTGEIDENILSPRLLVIPNKSNTEPIEGTENPVLLARKLLKELRLYNLMAEVAQAMYVDGAFGRGLLFAMSSSLQASEVVNAWVDPTGELTQHLQAAQVKRDFFEQ